MRLAGGCLSSSLEVAPSHAEVVPHPRLLSRVPGFLVEMANQSLRLGGNTRNSLDEQQLVSFSKSQARWGVGGCARAR